MYYLIILLFKYLMINIIKTLELKIDFIFMKVSYKN